MFDCSIILLFDRIRLFDPSTARPFDRQIVDYNLHELNAARWCEQLTLHTVGQIVPEIPSLWITAIHSQQEFGSNQIKREIRLELEHFQLIPLNSLARCVWRVSMSLDETAVKQRAR